MNLEQRLDELFENISPTRGIALIGMHGNGKTWQVNRLSNKFNVKIIRSLEELSELGEKTDKVILFLEEAQRMSDLKQQEYLEVMDKGTKFVVTKDKSKRPNLAYIQFNVQIIVILATTDPAKINQPLLSRCYQIQLPRYVSEDVFVMLSESFPQIPEEERREISKRCKDNPRRGGFMAEDYLKYGRRMYDLWQVDENGLEKMDIIYISELYHKEDASLRMMANILGLKSADVETLIEPYLKSKGWLELTSKGRRLSKDGREFFEGMK